MKATQHILGLLLSHLEAVKESQKHHDEPQASRVALNTLRTHAALFALSPTYIRVALEAESTLSPSEAAQ